MLVNEELVLLIQDLFSCTISTAFVEKLNNIGRNYNKFAQNPSTIAILQMNQELREEVADLKSKMEEQDRKLDNILQLLLVKYGTVEEMSIAAPNGDEDSSSLWLLQ